MTSYSNMYWGPLIDEGKKPSALLEQLCLGLAKIIGGLEPGTSPDNEVSPCRLAAFYRSCGGDFDELFKETSSHGLSFIYKTIGCVHSLQPTTPYETPSVPCLKPLGYLRWQTIQLQLDPAVHAPFLQKAVSIYNVPKPDGGTFPTHIPAEAFPSQPDKDIEDWWKSVTHSMNQENVMRRLGNSPYHSPHENANRTEYFTQNGRLSAGQRPYHPSRQNSEDRTTDERRRSSVPELVFNQNGDNRPDSKGKHSRSRSAQRISSGQHNYPPPAHPAPQQHPSSGHRPLNTQSPYRRSTNSSNNPNSHRRHRSSGGQTTPRRRHRSPSTINELTGSKASSEDSRSDGDRKRQEDRRRSSLCPPPFLHHHRRHSHDATYERLERAPPLPPRPAPIQAPTQTHVPRTDYTQPSPKSATRSRGVSNLNNVQFRNDIFAHETASNSAPETPVAPDYVPNQPRIPRMRYEPLLRTCTCCKARRSRVRAVARTAVRSRCGVFRPPARSKTVTMGVGGRRYPAVVPGSNGAAVRRGERTMSATPVGFSQSR